MALISITMNPFASIRSAVKRAAEIVSYYANEGIDLETVPKEQSKNRMEICRACTIPQPDGTEIKGLIYPTLNCRSCGCFMLIKTRLLFDPIESGAKGEKTLTHCPLGKW